MEVREWIQPGMSNEQKYRVEEQFTAIHVGSGSLRVLATPSMIAFMERTARDLLEQILPDGYSSVGVHVDIHHLAPTLMGGSVYVHCEVTEVEGPRVDFRVEARDDTEVVGRGIHQRVVIDVARFLRRVETKQAG